MSLPQTLPPTFNRLAWSNLSAQSAEQIALAAAPIVAVLLLGVGEGQTGLLQTALTLEKLAGDLEVLVDGLARDQQAHDLARSLKDAVDPHVTQDLLRRDRLLTPGEQRLRRLVTAAAPNLHQVVDHPPPELGGVELGDRRLDPDVVLLVVGEPAGDVDYRLEPERTGGDERELLSDGVVLADRLAPLDPFARPLAGDPGRPLGRANADRG